MRTNNTPSINADLNTPMRSAKYYWAKLDTRWHVYPQAEPTQLVAHNWEGFWCPLPDGRWYKSPVSFVLQCEADMANLSGSWTEEERVSKFVRDSV